MGGLETQRIANNIPTSKDLPPFSRDLCDGSLSNPFSCHDGEQQSLQQTYLRRRRGSSGSCRRRRTEIRERVLRCRCCGGYHGNCSGGATTRLCSAKSGVPVQTRCCNAALLLLTHCLRVRRSDEVKRVGGTDHLQVGRLGRWGRQLGCKRTGRRAQKSFIITLWSVTSLS